MVNVILQQQNMNFDPVINGIMYGLIVTVIIMLLIKVNYFNT